MAGTIEDKLAGLGVPKENIPEYIEVLSKVSTIKDLRTALAERNKSCDEEQYLAPRFRKLYETSPEVRERAERELGGLGVPADAVPKYFTEFGNCPGSQFHFAYEDGIPLKIRETFVQKADELMLQALRDYLGVS